MEKLTYVELVQNSTVLVRDSNMKRLTHKLKSLGLMELSRGKGVSIKEIITNIKKPLGSIFEGNL
jgi:hypothetical protein